MTLLVRLTLAAAVLATAAPPAVARTTAASPVASVTATANGIDLRRGEMVTQVVALTPTILRVLVAPDGRMPEDASWAVPAAIRATRASVTAIPHGFSTSALRVTAAPDGRLTVADAAGRVILADAADPVSAQGTAFTLAKQLTDGEHIFALGDKTGPLDRRGGTLVDWNTDVGRYDEATDPAYKSIPFFVAAGGAGGSYGLLLDNTWRVAFDFGHADPSRLSMTAPGGPIDYYVIAGPSIAQVVQRYADLTGKPPIAPLWSFGYQQSRYSYMSANEVRGVVGRFRRDRFPLDVMWLDIDFQDRNRPFTTDPRAYPDLPRLVRDLKGDGVRLVTITDLHVAAAPNQGYAPYDSGIAGDEFVHAADGSVLVGTVWPGASVFPDFTRDRSRAWWGGLYKGLVADGVSGFWNDMNEPALFGVASRTMPLDAVHRIEGSGFATRTATHAEIHNVFGMENTRATFEGLQRLAPDERPFVMTRATYAGGQRYAATWTGDNSSTWAHLKLAISQSLNLGLSGFGYTATDVGGFTGGASPELMTRWFEIATFMPLFRDHSAKDAPRAEPWADGPAQEAIRRRFVEERYRLLPYIYALADENSRTGAPLMRPVFYDYPDALAAPCDQSMAFTLGARLLVAPPPTPESPTAYQVCLPAGGWYDYWTGAKVTGAPPAAQPVPLAASAPVAPPSIVIETPRLDHLPVYVRAGAIIPRQPVVQSTAETPAGPLTLDVYPGPDCRGDLYLDDGHSLGYARGAYLRQAVRCAVAADGGVTITFGPRQGTFAPWWKTIVVTVHGWSEGVRATMAGMQVAASVGEGAARIEIADQAGGGVLAVAHGG